MPQVEINMIINTLTDVKNVNFFAPVKFSFENSREKIMELVSDKIHTMLKKYELIMENGYAIVFCKDEELFRMSFMKSKEGKEKIWKNYMMDYNDPTIH